MRPDRKSEKGDRHLQLFKHGTYSVALLTAGHFFNDFFSNFLPPLLPVVMTTLGLSLTSAGLLVMFFAFTGSILQPICGYFIDKSGYTWLILLSLPSCAFFICLIGVAPSYITVVACVLLGGLGSSAFHPLGSSLVSKVTLPENKGLAMSVFIGGGNIGFAVAPALVACYIMAFGVRNLPWLFLPTFALTLIFYFGGLHRITTGSPQKSAASGFPPWYRSLSLLKLNTVMSLRSWSQMALPNFLPLWLAEQGQPLFLSGELLTVFLLGGAAGGFIGGWLGDRIGRKNAIIALLTLCLPSMFFFVHDGAITPLAWVLLAIAGASLQGTLPPSIIWAQNIIPGNPAMASGMMLGLTFGLGGVGVAITGALADSIGLQAALVWSILPLVITIPLVATIPERQPAITRHDYQV